MNDVKSYVPPFAARRGDDGRRRRAGRRVAQRARSRRARGSCTTSAGASSRSRTGAACCRSTPRSAPVSTALGVLGMPGLTAYVGLLDIGRAEEGETVFVSGAAGAVGSVVGQIAKLKGCRVIGSAGSAEKVAWLRGARLRRGVRLPRGPSRARRCGEGIDVYFDNVGGPTLEAALAALRLRGRVVACGAISQYNATEPPPGPRNLVPRRHQAAADGGLHRLRPLRPDARRSSPRSAPWVRDGSVALPRDGRRRDRERARRLHRPARGREHREDARQGRAGRCAVSLALPACFGHKVPKARWFFLTERFQRCERCGERVRRSSAQASGSSAARKSRGVRMRGRSSSSARSVVSPVTIAWAPAASASAMR